MTDDGVACSSNLAQEGPKTLEASELANVIDVWKKTVDVQMHFNDIELRIRGLAMTVMGFLVGAGAFSLQAETALSVGDRTFSAAVVPVAAGLVLILPFYWMDRFWYHRLLLGAVKHGLKVEEEINRSWIGLASAIKDESQLPILRWKVRSTGKIDFFYGIFLAVFLVMLLLAVTMAPVTSDEGTASWLPWFR